MTNTNYNDYLGIIFRDKNSIDHSKGKKLNNKNYNSYK